ncbi:hypothetical protein [uncultured Agrobacterium sp.]|uniref:hypothetical protein n=1 Tax=uncultured Agrobacterium sp. TaxID=157277 RepID=UPI00258C7C01|nr:hypothetical protein [uncultured Agrobacterium sp.]
MTKNTTIMPHERGWAILRNGTLTKVYPSRHLALQALKEEMTRHATNSGKAGKELRHPAGTIRENMAMRGNREAGRP